MTFNKAAAIEMEKRFNNIFSGISDKRFIFRLFSFCNSVVKDYEKMQGKCCPELKEMKSLKIIKD